MKYKNLSLMMFVFTTMAVGTCSAWAKTGHVASAMVVAQPDNNVEQVLRAPANNTEENKDPHAEFLVYTGSSGRVDGLKFYEFDQEPGDLEIVKAVEFCPKKGLRLMTIEEAEDLSIELSPVGENKSNLTKWLNGKTYSYSMVTSRYRKSSYISWFLFASESGSAYVVAASRESDFLLRCVSR